MIFPLAGGFLFSIVLSGYMFANEKWIYADGLPEQTALPRPFCFRMVVEYLEAERDTHRLHHRVDWSTVFNFCLGHRPCYQTNPQCRPCCDESFHQ